MKNLMVLFTLIFAFLCSSVFSYGQDRITFWTESRAFFYSDQGKETGSYSGYLTQNYCIGLKVNKYFRIDLFSAVYSDWQEGILYFSFLTKAGNLNFEISPGFGFERESSHLRSSNSIFFYSDNLEGLGVYEFNTGYSGYYYTGYFVYKDKFGKGKVGIGLNFQYDAFVGPRLQYSFSNDFMVWFAAGPNIEHKSGGFGSGIFMPLW